MNKERTYEEAMAELELITKKMESGELPIDKMAENLKQAQALLAFCREQLMLTEKEINQILTPEQ